MRRSLSIRFWLGVLAICALGSVPCFCADIAVLRNGFSIKHERRETMGDLTRLYVTVDGSSFVDVPTAEIEHFESAPELPLSDSSSLATNAKEGTPTSLPLAANANHIVPSVPAPLPRLNLDEVVNSASGRYRLDPDLVNSVIKAESGFNARAVSPKGAQGLMQLMPGTASTLGVPNPFDPQANVEGGAKYLRELLELYNFDLVKALAAYNAGPQRVEQYKGVPPYYETRAYVARIVRDFNKKKAAQQKAAALAEKAAARKSKSPAAKPHGSDSVAVARDGAPSSE